MGTVPSLSQLDINWDEWWKEEKRVVFKKEINILVEKLKA